MQDFPQTLQKLKQTGNAQDLVGLIPYAQTLGVEIQTQEENRLLFVLPANHDVVGNPTLPAIHGGALSGFMEVSSALYLLFCSQRLIIPRVVDFSIDFLRAGRIVDTFASCEVMRQGARVANIQITAWQDDASQPIATARANFLTEPLELPSS
ncbi:PaaI family thioesterase [Sessilibacter corallicola]|uniref:PaaI family thioesterase n=1 Tax=Sessilibacter corallicola TaxID=2904075 RepID=A0ABQ0A6C6_9GAMM|nr:PaaI family thioesterase [Sessilibacter corallicola]MCE2028676.1 PaaI family thioesterase [Sessilibacter corallicola]